MAEAKTADVMKLKTVDEISAAGEWIFNQQMNNKIDGKQADSMNTTLKNQIYLNVKLKMDYLKIQLQAQIKKVTLPKGLLPEIEK